MIVVTITVPLLFLGALGYIVMNPEKAEKIAGWLWRLVSELWSVADRKAVAYSVQGDINDARADLARNAPNGVFGGKLKLRWANAEQAESVIREGEVIVFMGRSRDREANIANAVMAYLPKAVVPRARRYIDRETMKAADLTIARAILAHSQMPTGAIHAFFERHLDPALEDEGGLRDRLRQVDSIDLHGWLTRIVLNEYRIMGDRLYPGECDAACLADARAFCTWLANLAGREPGDTTWPLKYQGRYLSAGIVFVAQRDRIAREGLVPYRKRAKRLIYREKCDAVYLMARDHNIESVKQLRDDLEHDALVDSATTWEYALRPDFAARHGLRRERAIIVVLRRRRMDEEPVIGDDEIAAFEQIEVYDYATEAAVLNERPRQEPDEVVAPTDAASISVQR